MRIFFKILKWVGVSILSFLLLVVLGGLSYRAFGPAVNEPLGELVDIGDCKLHINSTGEKRGKPTLVVEGGGGMATEYYHWLSEGLKDSLRVVRYDRAGIGYSDACHTPRVPEVIARELHTLLERAGESPPYILAGHSLGGPYIRVFTELYPEEVAAMFLLDSTHPERAERITSIPSPSSFKFKVYIWSHKLQGVLGDLGIIVLFDKLFGPAYPRKMEGLPEEINQRTIDFLNGGKYIRTIGKELEQYHTTLKRAGEVTDFGDLPVRIFPAADGEIPEDIYQEYLKSGIDLRANRRESNKMQVELAGLSKNSKVISMQGNHGTIFTEKKNAEIICQEVLRVAREVAD